MELATLTTAATFLAIGALLASFVLAMIRLLSGPTLPDRVIALDLMAFIIIAFIIVYAVYSDEPAFLNVALGVGGVSRYHRFRTIHRTAESQARRGRDR